MKKLTREEKIAKLNQISTPADPNALWMQIGILNEKGLTDDEFQKELKAIKTKHRNKNQQNMKKSTNKVILNTDVKERTISIHTNFRLDPHIRQPLELNVEGVVFCNTTRYTINVCYGKAFEQDAVLMGIYKVILSQMEGDGFKVVSENGDFIATYGSVYNVSMEYDTQPLGLFPTKPISIDKETYRKLRILMKEVGSWDAKYAIGQYVVMKSGCPVIGRQVKVVESVIFYRNKYLYNFFDTDLNSYLGIWECGVERKATEDEIEEYNSQKNADNGKDDITEEGNPPATWLYECQDLYQQIMDRKDKELRKQWRTHNRNTSEELLRMVTGFLGRIASDDEKHLLMIYKKVVELNHAIDDAVIDISLSGKQMEVFRYLDSHLVSFQSYLALMLRDIYKGDESQPDTSPVLIPPTGLVTDCVEKPPQAIKS